jgi:hypothetical protein
MPLLEDIKLLKFLTKIPTLICKPEFLRNFTFLEIAQKGFRGASVEYARNRRHAVLEKPAKKHRQTLD